MGTDTVNWLTTKEAAARMRVSSRVVRKWIESGELSAWKAGKDWRISPDDLQRFIDQRRNT